MSDDASSFPGAAFPRRLLPSKTGLVWIANARVSTRFSGSYHRRYRQPVLLAGDSHRELPTYLFPNQHALTSFR